MNWTYDECLSQNPFFLYVQKYHGDLIKKAAQDNWIICVPRLGTLDANRITAEDVLEHILVPISELGNTHFHTLNKEQKLMIEDKCIICENKKHIRILFEETFYVDKFTKYVLFCIEVPLSQKVPVPKYNYNFLNLQDCISLLQEKHLNIMEFIHKYIKNAESHLATNDLLNLKSTISIWYKDIIKICDPKIKLAVETYIQHYTYNKLFSVICECTAESDASFNKIIRNITDIQIKDLELNEFVEGMPVAKFEFGSINNYTTILDKVSSLKRAIKVFSSQKSKLFITTEVTLKIFVFLIIKSNINNWIANLTFISQFRYTVNIFDEQSFIVTTLEAATEFIKSGRLCQTLEISNMQLFRFIKTGNLDSVKKCVQNETLFNVTSCHPLCNCSKCSAYIPFNLNSCDDKGLTALHVACFYGHPHIIEYLISQNVTIDTFDYSEMMPLHYAALKGHQNALLLLLHAGAFTNPRNGSGNTPLHLASNNGHENCVKALVYFAEQQGSSMDINCINNYGDTPLHLSSKWGFLGIANILIQYGAEVSVRNKHNQTPVDVAQNNLLKTTLMIKKSDNIGVHFTSLNLKSSHSPNKQVDLLLKSIENNDIPLMCFYLGIPMAQASSNDNSLNDDSNCHPLCNCKVCYSRQIINCETSVNKHPLNINSVNFDGFSSLHIAALHNNTDILRILLDSGANVNIKTRNLCTPLHLACINQSINAVREIIQCGGCDIDAQDSQGNTPLHYVATNNNSQIAEILLSNSGCFSIKNCAGRTPMEIARDKAYSNIVKLFTDQHEESLNDVNDLFS